MAGPNDSDGGFLSRWSRRKRGVERDQALVGPDSVQAPARTPLPLSTALPTPRPAPASVPPTQPLLPAAASQSPVSTAPPPPPPPTLADVALLNTESDFSRFVAPGVDGSVKNAALKKLFSDPRFNVMDRLDTYIDDYGAPDPLPENLLRQMAQSQFLGLFNDAPTPTPTLALTDAPPDENADLRLQPHDAAGPAGSDQGAGPDPAGQY